MKRKVSVLLFNGVALLFVLAVFGNDMIVSARGRSNQLPFKANCVTYPNIVDADAEQLVLEIPADCKGTHLRNGEWFADSTVVINAPPPFLQTGDMYFTAANGDLLFGTFFGFAMPKETGGTHYWGGYEITEGNGKFDGATGTGLYHGHAGETVGTAVFEGVLSFP